MYDLCVMCNVRDFRIKYNLLFTNVIVNNLFIRNLKIVYEVVFPG